MKVLMIFGLMVLGNTSMAMAQDVNQNQYNFYIQADTSEVQYYGTYATDAAEILANRIIKVFENLKCRPYVQILNPHDGWGDKEYLLHAVLHVAADCPEQHSIVLIADSKKWWSNKVVNGFVHIMVDGVYR